MFATVEQSVAPKQAAFTDEAPAFAGLTPYATSAGERADND